MKFLLYSILYLSVALNFVNGQEVFKEKKFGDISMEEMQMDSCDFYSGADAMVLFNVGRLYVSFEPTKGFIYELYVHKRIKIFTKAGKDFATDKILLLKSKRKSDSDDIRNFKAYTYNLVDGKIEKTKLKSDGKFVNDISDYKAEFSYTMPNVQVGSVLDIKYKIVSGFLGSLRTWYFQDLMPVKYSDFSYIIPDFLKYQINTYGNTYSIESKDINKNLTIAHESFIAYGKEISMKNILPLEKEEFMGSIWGNLSRLQFNLIYIDSKYSRDYDYGSTYEKMNEKLLKNANFGHRLKKGKFAKIWAAELEGKSKMEIVEFILKKLQTTIAWDKTYSIFSNKSGKSLLKKREGDIGDINWTLIQALKYYDIDVYPVIVKLKRFGIPNPVYSNIFEFDYLVALVNIDGKEYFCDASSDLPVGMVQKEALNDNGFVVGDKFRWVDMTKDANYTKRAMIQAKVENDFLYYNVKAQYKDYAALVAFNKKENNKFEDELKSKYPDYEFVNLDLDENNNRKVFKYSLELRKEIDDNELIIVDPVMKNGFTENPFKKDERMSNIDFTYLYKQNFVFSLIVPDGYMVEMPVNAQLKDQTGTLAYMYMAASAGNKVSVMRRYVSKRTVFSPLEYPTIKLFFEKMTSSNKQLILLKKQK